MVLVIFYLVIPKSKVTSIEFYLNKYFWNWKIADIAAIHIEEKDLLVLELLNKIITALWLVCYRLEK